MRDGKPAADLVRRCKESGRRNLGVLAGTITLPEGWDRPMTE